MPAESTSTNREAEESPASDHHAQKDLQKQLRKNFDEFVANSCKRFTPVLSGKEVCFASHSCPKSAHSLKSVQMQYEWAPEQWATFNQQLGTPNEALGCTFKMLKPTNPKEPWIELQVGDLAVFDLDPKVYCVTSIQAYQSKQQTGVKMP